MPLFLTFTFLFAIYLHYQIKKTDKVKPEKESLIEKETRANFTRKADISTLNYIELSLESLPFLTEISSSSLPPEVKEELLSYEKIILSLKDTKILNLTGISNTDLKFKYGPANLPFLMQYDENFSKLSRTLSKWGKLLYESGNNEAAKSVLEFAVSLKCDIEDIFIVLGEIYKSEYNIKSLSSLKAQLDCFDESRRASLSRKLDRL